LAAIGIANPHAVARRIMECPERLELARKCATPAVNLVGRHAGLAKVTPAEIRP
jgi:hypothetical protein